ALLAPTLQAPVQDGSEDEICPGTLVDAQPIRATEYPWLGMGTLTAHRANAGGYCALAVVFRGDAAARVFLSVYSCGRETRSVRCDGDPIALNFGTGRTASGPVRSPFSQHCLLAIAYIVHAGRPVAWGETQTDRYCEPSRRPGTYLVMA